MGCFISEIRIEFFGHGPDSGVKQIQINMKLHTLGYLVTYPSTQGFRFCHDLEKL